MKKVIPDINFKKAVPELTNNNNNNDVVFIQGSKSTQSDRSGKRLIKTRERGRRKGILLFRWEYNNRIETSF